MKYTHISTLAILLTLTLSISRAEQPGSNAPLANAVLPDAPLPVAPLSVLQEAPQQTATGTLAQAHAFPTNCAPLTNSATATTPDAAHSGSSGHHHRWCYYQPVTAKEKFIYQMEEPFGPRGIFMPAIAAAIQYPSLGNKRGYPNEWTEGAGAFGRNLGDHYARNFTARAGELIPALAFHERVRYTRSTSTNTMSRIGHALAGTLVGKSDSGHYMPSFVNFGGAAGSGFVGMAYLPDGFNDVTHAGQRSIRRLAGYSTGDLFKEFSPEIGRALSHLHLPQIPHFPVWWTGNKRER